MSKTHPTRRGKERTRFHTPDDYWGPHSGQADFPDEPVQPTPKKPIAAGPMLPGDDELPAKNPPRGEGALIPDPHDEY